jgi:hypothetical protein
MLATSPYQPMFVGRSVPVTGHIWRRLESVNAFLQFYFKARQTRGNLRQNESFGGSRWAGSDTGW